MRVDLLHAQASIDWAVNQLPSFGERVTTWLDENLLAEIVEENPPGPRDVVLAVKKGPLPLPFVVKAGAYLNAIRSSLDILAVSLCNRFAIGKTTDTCFPVAPTEQQFKSGDYKGAKFLHALPATARQIIERIKPYREGNATLYFLHQLDILRKHSRLLTVEVNPLQVRTQGFVGFEPVPKVVNDREKIILGSVPRSIVKPEIKVFGYIALNENETKVKYKQPIGKALVDFASLATAIISQFDRDFSAST